MAPKRKLNRGLEALLGTGLLNKPDTDTPVSYTHLRAHET